MKIENRIPSSRVGWWFWSTNIAWLYAYLLIYTMAAGVLERIHVCTWGALVSQGGSSWCELRCDGGFATTNNLLTQSGWWIRYKVFFNPPSSQLSHTNETIIKDATYGNNLNIWNDFYDTTDSIAKPDRVSMTLYDTHISHLEAIPIKLNWS